jgi:hypothetical protein
MTPHTKRASEVLREALKRLGPNGERWISGLHWSGGKTCAGNAIYECADRIPTVFEPAQEFFATAIGGCGLRDIWRWNDDPSRTWPEVEAAFQKAITLAEEAEGKSNG